MVNTITIMIGVLEYEADLVAESKLVLRRGAFRGRLAEQHVKNAVLHLLAHNFLHLKKSVPIKSSQNH